MRFLLLLLIGLPVLELLVLIQVGRHIGALPTLGLLVLTALLGLALLRRQGYAILASARSRVALGELPGAEMLSGLFLAAAGMLLLIPGFITDVLGLCCLLPPLRRGLIAWVARRLWRPGQGTSRVIEGEFERERRPAPSAIEALSEREQRREPGE